MNLHIAPFMIMFFIGMAITISSSVAFRYRTRTIVTHPGDRYLNNNKEKKFLAWGISLIIAGIIGSGIMTDLLGHYYTSTDINGNVSVLNSKDRGNQKKDYEL